MGKSTITSRRETDLIMLILLFVSWIFWYQGIRLNRQIGKLESEIETLASTTAEIRTTLPALEKAGKQVLMHVIPGLVPEEYTDEWSSKLINFPKLNHSFERSYKIQQPKIPLGMQMPRILRDANPYLYPGLIPFQLDVNVNGTLDQISEFLAEIKRQSPEMIISEADLHPSTDTEQFKGQLTLAFPKIQYSQDLAEIRCFVNKHSSLAEKNRLTDR